MDDHNSEATTMIHWQKLGRKIRQRLRAPLQNPTFILYFLALMLGVGLIGTWSAIWEAIVSWKLTSDVPYSLATYSIAVVASAFAEVVIEGQSVKSQEQDSSDSAYRMFSLSIVIVAVALGLVALGLGSHPWFGTVVSVFAVLLGLFLWWIVNAENPSLRIGFDDAQSPIGGDIGPTDDLPGTLDGLKS